MDTIYFYGLIGIAAIGYGVYTLILRFKSPKKFGKLEAMKETWGEKTGLLVHIISYTVIPIVLGIVMLIRCFYGL